MKQNWFFALLLISLLFVQFVSAYSSMFSSKYKNKHRMKLKLRHKLRYKHKLSLRHKSHSHSHGHRASDSLVVPGSGLDTDVDKLRQDDDGSEEKESPPDYRDKDFANIEDTEVQLQDWLTISSPTFRNQEKFPYLKTQENGILDISIGTPNFQRLNFFNFNLLPEEQRPPKLNIFFTPKKLPVDKIGDVPKISPQDEEQSKKDYFWFWFRASGRYIYYSSNPKLVNQLGTFNLKNLVTVFNKKRSKHCFDIADKQGSSYEICAENLKTKAKWLCYLQNFIKMKPLDALCLPKGAPKEAEFKIKTTVQPVMLIPTPSRQCNERWDYGQNGRDWECKCKEGMEQSPINLPNPLKAIQSKVSPLFKYEDISPEVREDSSDGVYKAGDKLRIVYEKGALRIRAPTFGKIVTLDGGVYKATEIIFNTPSNHEIEGKKFDMEMQIIHKGISVGDIAKSVILCFLFKKKAGSTNKFLEKLEVFNLPNPLEPYREINNNIFIPNILLEEDEEELGVMNPFSFYTYQGSLQEPPCSERTVMYVASNPILVSHYSMQLMKEALRFPDQIDQHGNVKLTESILDNYRVLQRQHGRSIFYYDSSLCHLMTKKKHAIPEKGHYEKVVRPARRYFYVDGEKPSGISNAWVVTEKEALGNNELPLI